MLGGTGAANCGKVVKPDNCSLVNTRFSTGTPVIVLDYYPETLSFDYNFSDTWFAYLYDTSNNGGIIGTPCYFIETQRQNKALTRAADPQMMQDKSVIRAY